MKNLVILTAIWGAGGCIINDGTDAEPALFEVGPPLPVAFQPGVVEHEVCVATNRADGYVRASDFIGLPDVEFIGPSEGAPVQVLPLDGLDCPTSSGSFEANGFARIRWLTQSGRNLVTFVHEDGPFVGGDDSGGGGGDDFGDFKRTEKGAGPLPATRGELVLDGEGFPGYEVFPSPVDDSQDGVLGVVVEMQYREAGVLEAQPAADVSFAVSTSPVDIAYFGSSTGFDTKADRDGFNTVLYNVSTFCASAYDPSSGEPTNVSVFVTPTGGGTTLAGTLEFDSYCSTF